MRTKENSWQVDHLMLCLHEEYRFDRRHEIQSVMAARARLRDAEDDESADAALADMKTALVKARPIFEAETDGAVHDWVQGILEMMVGLCA